jgi:hypothetical protein
VANPPDFELLAGLRARVLVSHAPPNARLKTKAEDVALEREDARRGLPAEMRPGGSYSEIAVQKRVVGRIATRRGAGGAPRVPGPGRGYNLGR